MFFIYLFPNLPFLVLSFSLMKNHGLLLLRSSKLYYILARYASYWLMEPHFLFMSSLAFHMYLCFHKCLVTTQAQPFTIIILNPK